MGEVRNACNAVARSKKFFMMSESIRIERATEKDIPLILKFIKELAEYERLSEQCVATEALLRESIVWREKIRRSCHRLL